MADVICRDGHRLVVRDAGLSICSPDADTAPVSVVLPREERLILAGHLAGTSVTTVSADPGKVYLVNLDGHPWVGVRSESVPRWRLLALSSENPRPHRWSESRNLTVIGEYHRSLIHDDPPPPCGAVALQPYLIHAGSDGLGVGVRRDGKWSVIGLEFAYCVEHTDDEVTVVSYLDTL